MFLICVRPRLARRVGQQTKRLPFTNLGDFYAFRSTKRESCGATVAPKESHVVPLLPSFVSEEIARLDCDQAITLLESR